MHWTTRAGALLAAIALPAQAAGPFHPEDIMTWEERRFEGTTQYEVTEIDGRPALHARCDGAASGLYLKREIDLDETPVLEWSWRIKETFDGDIDETVREGDDFPVRVYVVVDGGWLPWRSRSIAYVWASEQPAGSDWPNPWVKQVRMLALRSGGEAAGDWVTERRNLREDFQRLHDRSPSHIDAVAIMTDCDNRDSRIEGWYGRIRLQQE